MEILSEMGYCSAVIKETLRIEPPASASISYLTKEEVEICGVKLPKD